jgi:acyl carrier protein
MDPAWRSIPYGHPIANTRYYVLDDSLRECPVDVAGELWCAGVGLMKGYWHDEARTRDKFAAHPGTGERIYRTGDRGRLRPDGEIEFLGRTDAQVKILGQRIELGEIESILGQFPGIRQAAVKVATVGDQPRLVAYVVSPGEPRIREIRVHLERNLPCHMVPSAVEYLPSLPLTANGKVNREALPMPRIWMPATSCMAPESPVREPIHEIWRDVLKVEQVGIDDNFFDRGGNSLLLVQVHAELLRRLNLNLPVTALFEFPTIRALRRHINGLSSNDGPEDLEARMNSRRQALARRRAVMSRHD